MCAINLKKVMYRRDSYDDSFHLQFMRTDEDRRNDIIPVANVVERINRQLNITPTGAPEEDPLRALLIFLYELSDSSSEEE